MKKLIRNPFEVWELEINERSTNDEKVLKTWLKNIDFFVEFPDLIMDRVCENLKPVEYLRNQIVMGKGDESTFMIVIYSGEIGIYLQTVKELEVSGTEGKCIAKKLPCSVLGDTGLLKGATRGATCIALSDIKALYLSASNYCKIVESFHRSQLYLHIDFNKRLGILKDISYAKAERLAACYNSLIYKKGQTIVDIGQEVNQLYIVKKGTIKVEKKIEL